MVCRHILAQAPVLELERARALASYHKDLAQAPVLEPVRVPALALAQVPVLEPVRVPALALVQAPGLEPVRVLALASYHRDPQRHARQAPKARRPSSSIPQAVA